MSCQTCGIVLDCPDQGNPSDIAIMSGLYQTNPFIITVDCPAGYYCVPGIFPAVINPGPPPGVTIDPDGGLMILQSCLGAIILHIPPGSGAVQIQALMHDMQVQWSKNQALCIVLQGGGGGGGNPTFPAPTRTPPGSGRQDVFNETECYTAFCGDGSIGATRCVDQGTIFQTLFNATPGQIAQAQSAVNASALQTATKEAQDAAKPVCGICNSALHYAPSCPGQPQFIANVNIPSGKYCVASGTPNGQTIVDSQASVDANNQAHAQLQAMGCSCPGFTIDNSGIISANCMQCGTWNLNSQFTICIGDGLAPACGGVVGTFNPVKQFTWFNSFSCAPPGFPIHSVLNINTFRIEQWFP